MFTFSLIFIILQIINIIKLKSEIIDISEYEYPSPTQESEDEYNIAIFGTCDIHGYYYPIKRNIEELNISYTQGGLEYMGKYISIIREKWKERFLWFDAGDQFEGGYENTLSNGTIIPDFFNIMNLSSCTIGNHDWDFGNDYLRKIMNYSNYSYIISNIQEISTRKKEFFPKQLRYKIFNAGKIKVGVIGLAKNTKSYSSLVNLTDIDFLNYIKTIKEISNILRNKTDIIILISHFGMECPNQNETETYTLQMINSTMNFTKCSSSSDLYILLKNLPKDLIDIVISGHTHYTVHQWFFNYPVVSTDKNGVFANIIYLTFKKNTDGSYQYISNKTLIEGPLPICEKVFDKKLNCRNVKAKDIEKSGNLVNYKFHNVLIEKEKKLEELSKKWESQLEKDRNDILTEIDKQLSFNKKKESYLNNLITDIIREKTKCDISLINANNFRSNLQKGNISVADIYYLYPFKINIVSFEMSGLEVKKMLKIIQTGSSYYATSGIKQLIYINNKTKEKKLINILLFDGLYEREIENNKIYKIGTSDFLIPFGFYEFKNVISWYKIRNLKYYGDSREIFISYLRNIPKIFTHKLMDEKNPRLRIIYE